MIKIYDKGGPNGYEYGLGVLEPYSCKVHEEENGDYSVKMEISANDELCTNERILFAPTPKHGMQKFRIYDSEKTLMGVKTVYARHIFYDLYDNYIDDIRPTDCNGAQALERMFAGLNFTSNITGTSNIETINTAYWEMINPVEALIGTQENSFINRWGGVLDRDNETFTINTEANEPIDILYGRDLEECGLRADHSTVITRIVPTGLKADGQSVLKLPELYVDSARINDYVSPKIKRIHYSDIRVGPNKEDYATEEDAFTALRERAKAEYASGIDLPTISGTVSIIDLRNTKEYKNAKGLVKIVPFTPVRIWVWGGYVEAKMQAYDYDALAEKYEKITLGVKDRYVGETMETQLYKLSERVNLIEQKIQ